MKGVHQVLRSAVSTAALLLAFSVGANAESSFPQPSPDFRGAMSFSAGSAAVPVLAGTEVTAQGRDFVPGQDVTLLRGQTVLATGKADAEGKVTLKFTVPADASTGQHSIIVLGDNPSATLLQPLKVSPTIALSGAEKFTLTTASAAKGLYQVAYSEASNSLFLTSSVGRPPVKQSELVKINPETMEVVTKVVPGEAPARPDGSSGGVFAVYGVAVDDEHGTVWATNTRQDTVAVYKQDDLSLVKQFEPNAAKHPFEAVVDPEDDRVFISGANGNEISTFNSKTLEKTGVIKVDSAMRGKTFTTMGISYDPAAGKLYSVSLTTPEAAVIDAKTGKLDRIIPMPGASSSTGVVVVPEANRLYVVSQGSDDLRIIDLATDTVIAVVPVGAGSLKVAYEPTAKQIFVANRGSSTIAVLDLDGNWIANLDAGSLPNHLVADGKGNIWAVNKSAGEDDPKGDLLWKIHAAQ